MNTAARLESFDKASYSPDYAANPSRILIGDATRAYLGKEFLLAKVGEISLRGKDRGIVGYQVLGESAKVPESKYLSG